jgi:hypothetical protein
MSSCDRWSVEGALAAFDEHLCRTRGVCAGTRRNYVRFVQAFLQMVFASGPVEVARLGARDVVGFVAGSARPLPAEDGGACRVGAALVLAVPARGGVVRRAVGGRGADVAASPERPGSASGRGVFRAVDRLAGGVLAVGAAGPVIVCMARLGLRASEVVQLRLEDLDWRDAVVRVRARKTGLDRDQMERVSSAKAARSRCRGSMSTPSS